MAVRLIVFTVVALSLVNAYSFVKLYSSTFVADKSLTVRGPASEVSESFTPENFKVDLALDLNCGQFKRDPFKASGQWAQLKGKVCKPKKGSLVIEITNMNNGFTASVFDLGAEKYQTDLIQLDKGANKIRVRFVSPLGSIEEQTLTIENGYI